MYIELESNFNTMNEIKILISGFLIQYIYVIDHMRPLTSNNVLN